MKINIRGNDITPEKIADALRSCERDGLKISGCTILVHYKDHLDRSVEPLENGNEIIRNFSFWKKMESEPQKPPVDPITANEMISLCKSQAHRALSAPEMTALLEISKVLTIDRKRFIECLERSIAKCGSLNVNHLISAIRGTAKVRKH